MTPAPSLKLYPGEARAVLAIGALLLLLGLNILFDLFGTYLMKKLALFGALAAAALALGGCATALGRIPEADRAAVLAGASEHIQQCDREYWANTGLPGSAGLRISCKRPQDAGELAAAVAAAVKAALSEALAAAGQIPPPESPK